MSIHASVYIYICLYTNFIKHNRHSISTYFLLDPFEFPYYFYRFRRELIYVLSIVVCIPFCPILGHHHSNGSRRKYLDIKCPLCLMKLCLMKFVLTKKCCQNIHIFIYRCVLWVTGGIISGIFETAPECLEDLPLSILARRPHKELCPREPARPEASTKDVAQSGVILRSRESDIQAHDAELVRRL